MKEQAMLPVHLVLTTVTETRLSRIPELQAENAAQRHHIWCQSAALEGRFVGNCGKQPQLDGVPEACLLQWTVTRLQKTLKCKFTHGFSFSHSRLLWK